MASKGSGNADTEKQEELIDITTCCICTDVYADPKALPCIHTFCMKCIQETGFKTGKRPGDEMPCPLCRRLFKIPQEGFPGLPKHFFIERLIQVTKVSEAPSVSRTLCSMCHQEIVEDAGKETPAADSYCIDCKHYFCEECSSQHKKFKLTKDHTLIPITEYERGQNMTIDLASVICQLHKQKVLDVFCADCKLVVCAICFIEKHKEHTGIDVSNCVDGFRKQIQNQAKEMIECIAQVQMKKAELVMEKEEMQRKVGQIECDIENRKAELKQFADEHAQCLKRSLYSKMQSKLKEFQITADEINAHLLNMENYNSYCQRLMAEGSGSDICREVFDLSVRATELQQRCLPVIEEAILDFQLCFRQSELRQFIEDSGNLIGEIAEEGDLQPKKVPKRPLSTEQSNDRDISSQEIEEPGEDRDRPRPTCNCNAQIEELKEELGNNQTAVNALQVDFNRIKQELDAEKTTNKELRTIADKAEGKYKKHTDELTQELASNKTAFEALRATNKTLQQELDAKETTNTEMTKALENNRTAITALQDNKLKLEQELDSEKANNNSLQIANVEQNDKYDERIEKLTQELETNMTAFNALRDNYGKLEQEHDEARKNNNFLRTRHYKLLEELDMCKATVKTLETNTEKLLEELKTSKAGHLTNDEIKRRIRRHYVSFISDVDPDLLGDYLKMENVLSIDQWQTITANKFTAKEKCRAVLDFLLSCDHPHVFRVILQALERVDHHILDEIEKDSMKISKFASTDQRTTIERSISSASGQWIGSREALYEGRRLTKETSLPELQALFQDRKPTKTSMLESMDACAAQFSDKEESENNFQREAERRYTCRAGNKENHELLLRHEELLRTQRENYEYEEQLRNDASNIDDFRQKPQPTDEEMP